MAHSLAGLEALYWANQFPDEVEAIVGLDIAVPRSYELLTVPAYTTRPAKVLTDLGYARFLYPAEKAAPALSTGQLTEAETASYKALFYRRPISMAVMLESEAAVANAQLVRDLPLPTCPVLLYVSNAEGTSFDRDTWYQLAQETFGSAPNAHIQRLDVGHYVHDYAPDEIAAGIREFIK